MTHKLDNIKLFCSECGGVDDNGEFTLRKEVYFVECYDAASLLPTLTG